MKLSSFRYLIHQGVKGIWTNRMMTFASFCILLVSLLMVGIASLTAINLTRVIGGIEDKSEVVVIIKDTATAEDITELKEKLQDIPNVNTVEFYSKEEAWENMLETMTEEEKNFFRYADDNPLPDTYKITVRDIENMADTTAQIDTFDDLVESTQSPTSLADVLISIRRIFSIVAFAVVFALVVVSLIIISNTTRASVFARRKEINIMKYVGATNSFIRIPFFVEGMLVGLAAAVGALFLTKFAYDGVYNIFSDNMSIWRIIGMQRMFPFNDVFWPVCISYLVAGTVIGAVGTSISTSKHLRV